MAGTVQLAIHGALMLVLAGCAAGGPTGTTSASGADRRSSPGGTTVATNDGFHLMSPDVDEGGAIPRRFTCDGEDVSPALEWAGVPDRTAALALIVDDPDARGFVHWIVLDMSGTASGGLSEGMSPSPDAPRQGRNDFGRIGYGGPCPPSGTHRYVFTLYALDAPLSLPGTPGAADVRAAMEGHVLAEAQLTARYTRGG
ncbi:MAG TPA: YbhB/YbcL family Raf kinase inhibitor-like protein [Candidatus Limnocylindria bacterium]|nr:YbhB/YbcL family Raf kinase inhibitor-like protein [Candidatus Limnocylindria bacterium]